MSNTTRNKRALMMVVLAAGSFAMSGCASPATQGDSQLSKAFQKPAWLKAPWSKSEEEQPEPYPNPVKVASTWAPDVLVQTGKTPTRGFGGRLFFFDEKTKAVPVEGTLTVHGFELDAQGRDSQIKPFKFTPEQFTKHFSQSDFGASYSVWIPWDAAGGEEKRVSLVPTFETTEGKIVQGSPATIVLPGRRSASQEAVAANVLSPQYRGHKDAITQHTTRPSGLVTTTIRRYSTTPDGKSSLPSGSLQDRVNALLASQRIGNSGGNTPFIDIRSNAPRQSLATVPQASGVMPASATMNGATDNKVRPAGSTISAPRRIKSPVSLRE